MGHCKQFEKLTRTCWHLHAALIHFVLCGATLEADPCAMLHVLSNVWTVLYLMSWLTTVETHLRQRDGKKRIHWPVHSTVHPHKPGSRCKLCAETLAGEHELVRMSTVIIMICKLQSFFIQFTFEICLCFTLLNRLCSLLWSFLMASEISRSAAAFSCTEDFSCSSWEAKPLGSVFGGSGKASVPASNPYPNLFLNNEAVPLGPFSKSAGLKCCFWDFFLSETWIFTLCDSCSFSLLGGFFFFFFLLGFVTWPPPTPATISVHGVASLAFFLLAVPPRAHRVIFAVRLVLQ